MSEEEMQKYRELLISMALDTTISIETFVNNLRLMANSIESKHKEAQNEQ